MPELIHEHSERIVDSSGATYVVYVYGEPRADGTWRGWIEFHPLAGGAPALRTGQETSQPDKKALIYWASGLEPIYLEGAFDRARPIP
ncbi:MAG TPA: hypothetical protein VFQ92_25115 [Blastocatellia bacterium]|nr:hypothetical protein [Blastocatellia bacterium]